MRRNNSRGIGRMFTEAGGIAERLPLLDGVAQVEVVQKKSGPGKTRTCDIQFRKLTFCPAELRDHVLCGNRRKDSNKPPPERTPCAVSKRKLSFPRYRLNLTQPNCNGRSCRRRLLWGIQNSC